MDETAQNNSGSSQFLIPGPDLVDVVACSIYMVDVAQPISSFSANATLPCQLNLQLGRWVTYDTNTLEGLLTWTYARILGRLARAT